MPTAWVGAGRCSSFSTIFFLGGTSVSCDVKRVSVASSVGSFFDGATYERVIARMRPFSSFAYDFCRSMFRSGNERQRCPSRKFVRQRPGSEFGSLYAEGWPKAEANANGKNTEFGFQYSTAHNWYTPYLKYTDTSGVAHLMYSTQITSRTKTLVRASTEERSRFKVLRTIALPLARVQQTAYTCNGADFAPARPTGAATRSMSRLRVGVPPVACSPR
jgi:hypothetical protein